MRKKMKKEMKKAQNVKINVKKAEETEKSRLEKINKAAEIKKEKANLNKLKKALNDEKIRQKKLFSEPIVLFEADVKNLISMIENAVSGLDSQLKAFNEEEKAEKKEKKEKTEKSEKTKTAGTTENIEIAKRTEAEKVAGKAEAEAVDIPGAVAEDDKNGGGEEKNYLELAPGLRRDIICNELSEAVNALEVLITLADTLNDKECLKIYSEALTGDKKNYISNLLLTLRNYIGFATEKSNYLSDKAFKLRLSLKNEIGRNGSVR